jgi:large subunit ribosomal protein L3
MSRVFAQDGEAVAVTYLEVPTNTIVRTKSEERDGYNAVVLGVGPKNWKTRKGNEHIRYETQKEWKVESLEGLAPGTKLTASSLPAQSIVTVTGISKGKGFAGVMKRHGFAGGPKTHGSHMKRTPGSIGMCAYPGHVLKGQKMPGHMGMDTVTLRSRAVVACDPEKGIVAIRGPVPGAPGTHVFLTIESAPDAMDAGSSEDAPTSVEEEAPTKDDAAMKQEKAQEKAPEKDEAGKEDAKKEDVKKEDAKKEEADERSNTDSPSQES